MIFDYYRWRDRLAEGMDERLYTAEYLDRLIVTGAARLFANDRAAMVVEIKSYPTGALVVHALVAAGDKDAIIEMAPIAETWGQQLGCIGAVVESRPAWMRELKNNGYRPFQSALWKDLGGI